MKKIAIILVIVASGFLNCTSTSQENLSQHIQLCIQNPHYFAYKGKPVLLLGGSDEDNLFNNPYLMEENLETLYEVGGNYIRCTMSSRDNGNVWPFAQKQNGLYDLDQYNKEYWNRFENCLVRARDYDIIVQVEIWATFDFYRDYWTVNPFNPANNINYSTDDTQLKSTWPHHPASKPQPFFFSVPEQNNDSLLIKYQRKFVDKLLSISLNYDNVLYCMDNETRAPAEWAWYWADYVQKKAYQSGVPVMLTEMWDAHDLHNKEHRRTYDHLELFAYFDISQNNWQEGQTHYDNALWVRNMLQDHGGVRPLTNIKVYHRRHDNMPNTPSVGVDRWWQNIFAGCASTRFHRPTGGTGLNPLSQQNIRAARTFTDAFNIFACQPHPDLLSDTEPNEAYCLADPGNTYALYFPTGGNITLKLEETTKQYKITWFDPVTLKFYNAKTITGNSVQIQSPNMDQIWLALINIQ